MPGCCFMHDVAPMADLNIDGPWLFGQGSWSEDWLPSSNVLVVGAIPTPWRFGFH